MVYWKNSADSDFISAKVVNLAKSPARQFNLESGIKTAGMLVDEETTEIGIMEKPFFMAGWMNEATRLVSEPGQPSGNTSIVYIKEGNVWLYDTKTGQPRQITSDGKPNSMEGVAKQYLKALVSPNGAYVAFDSSYGYFFIYNLETGQATPIAKVSSPDIAGDALLGWDDNNRLYYTRTNGECVVTAELKGPDSVDVLRFEPESGNSERISTLPKVWDAPHAYSIGISISPKGRYVKAYNGACSVGLKTTFLWDMHKETYFFDSYKDVVVSNDESMTAYIDDSEVVYEDYEIGGGSTKIYRSNPDMQEQVLLYSPAKERRINYGLSWSPDDQLLAFMEYPGGKGADYSIIKIITSEGAEVQTLPGQNILFGSWSPDGKSIVYTQIDPSGDFRAPGRMVIFNLDSQTATEIDMIDRWSTPDW